MDRTNNSHRLIEAGSFDYLSHPHRGPPYPFFGLEIGPPSFTHYIPTPDLPSLLDALHSSRDFPSARISALQVLYTNIRNYLPRLWRPSPQEDYQFSVQEYRGLRREVFDLVRVCARQEIALLEAAMRELKKELIFYGQMEEDDDGDEAPERVVEGGLFGM
jgi:hypothetical protein